MAILVLQQIAVYSSVLVRALQRLSVQSCLAVKSSMSLAVVKQFEVSDL